MDDVHESAKKHSDPLKPVFDESENNIQRAVSIDEKDIDKLLKDDPQLKELLRANKVAVNYIDNRSGGVFFYDKTQIDGDVVGRGQFKKQAYKTIGVRPEEAVSQILVDDLAKVNSVYLQVEKYFIAYESLVERNIIILWGKSHIGKLTTALHMLHRLHEDVIFELDPSGSLKLANFANSATQGYVIDTYSAEKVGELSVFNLNKLSSQLKKNKSHLIITFDDRVHLVRNEGVNKYLVVWDEVPNTMAMLEKHLDWYATTPSIRQESGSYCLSNEIQTIIQLPLLPGEVDRLAKLLIEVVLGKFELAIAVERFNARTGEQVEKWFEENLDLRDRILLISAAVYNGASYQIVANAEKELSSLLQKSEDKKMSVLLDPFSSLRSRRIRNIEASLKPGFEETEFGHSPVEIVELNNPVMQPAIVEFVWKEADSIRDVLVQWLRSAVIDTPFDMRIRAAAAVGELAKHDFGYIRRELLLPWGTHSDYVVRAAAAFSLGIPAWESEMAPLVLGLLHHWCTINNWRLCWTATAAYGGLVGLRFPDAALRDLYQVANTGDVRLIGILFQSIKNIFNFGETTLEYRIKVLETLIDWAEKEKEAAGLVSLFAFLYLAGTANSNNEESKFCPVILKLLQEHESFKEKTLDLWRRSFNQKITRSLARSTMRDWVKAIDVDESLFENFSWLALNMISSKDERETERFRAYLKQWNDELKESKTIAKILSII